MWEVFNIGGGGGSAIFGIDRLLVGPLAAQAIFKIIGGLPGPYSSTLAPTPMLHVHVYFEISPESQSIPYTSY